MYQWRNGLAARLDLRFYLHPNRFRAAEIRASPLRADCGGDRNPHITLRKGTVSPTRLGVRDATIFKR